MSSDHNKQLGLRLVCVLLFLEVFVIGGPVAFWLFACEGRSDGWTAFAIGGWVFSLLTSIWALGARWPRNPIARLVASGCFIGLIQVTHVLPTKGCEL